MNSHAGSQRPNFSLTFWLLGFCVLVVLIGSFLLAVRWNRFVYRSNDNRIALPDADKAQLAILGLAFEYSMSEHVLDRNEVACTIEIKPEVRWPNEHLPFSREKFVEELERQVNRKLDLDSGARVTRLDIPNSMFRP